MAKTSKEYSEILRSVLAMTIKEIFDNPRYEESDYLQGQVAGLYTAIDKIDKSQFMTE